MFLGEGFEVGFKGVVGGGGGFLLKTKEKGEGFGRWGRWVGGPANGTGKSMRMRLSKLPFSDLPFSSSLTFAAR